MATIGSLGIKGTWQTTEKTAEKTGHKTGGVWV